MFSRAKYYKGWIALVIRSPLLSPFSFFLSLSLSLLISVEELRAMTENKNVNDEKEDPPSRQ